MGLTFYFTVVALGATPVALSSLPRLARQHAAGRLPEFREVLGRGVALVLFVTLPAAAGLVVLARPLGDVIAVGRMGSGDGVRLVAAALGALAPGIVGEGLFQVLTYASYARGDTAAPLRAAVLQVLTFLLLSSASVVVAGPRVLLVLGIAFSVAAAVGAAHLTVRLRRDLGGIGRQLTPSLRRVLGGAAVMAGPAWAAGELLPRWVGGRGGSVLAVGTAALLGAGVFLLLQAWWRAPELAWLTGGLGRSGRSPATAGGDP
jgi:putative peptidoglycan lipid II flippase